MKPFYLALLSILIIAAPAKAASPVVLELFTSQGCSACPPADALLQKLAADPRVLALSFHIDYWDSPEWKDPFSLHDGTVRQELYERMLKQENLYTPEVVIDGQRGMTGSRKEEITTNIDVLSERQKPISVSLQPSADHTMLTIEFSGQKPSDVQKAGLWLISFSPRATSAIRGGENNGRELTSINNVTSITRLGQLKDQNPEPMRVKTDGDPASGYAVLVQEPSGRIIGAGSYIP